jgi:hypothetical protein
MLFLTLTNPFLFMFQINLTSIVFSLMSGVFLGFNFKDESSTVGFGRLSVSLLPAVIGYVTLLLNPMASFIFIMLGMLSMIPLNLHWSKIGILPKWFGVYFLSIALVIALSLIFSLMNYIRSMSYLEQKKKLQSEEKS